MNKRYINYEIYGILISELTEKIIESKQVFDVVFGIPKGGLPVAVHLAHHLNLPLLTTTEKITRLHKKILIADEIVDTGKTIAEHQMFFEFPQQITISSLFYKPSMCKFEKSKPKFFVEETDKWIVFPWEKE